jgi:uncharacterized protein (TIGR03067 family)
MAGPLLTPDAPAGTEAPVDAQKRHGLVEDCWDEPDAPGVLAGTGLEVLQGAWFSVNGRRDAEFLVAGDHFTFRFADGDIYMGSVEVDGESQPRLMTMRIAEGPAKHRGKVALCFFEQDGDALRWCATEPGRDERLSAFPAEDDPKYLILHFRRAERV